MPRTPVDGLEIVWDVTGPADGETVLMINGLGAARGSWSLQVAALAERYRVYTFDNRDVGETGSGVNPHPYGMARFARDTVGLIEALEIGPTHVIGASMGGTIAQELALARPELVRSLQIVCSWSRTDAWMAELLRQWKTMFSTMGPFDWSRHTWVWVFTHRWFEDPERVAEVRRQAEAYPYPQTPEMFARQADAWINFDALDRIPAIAAPVHVVVGAEDILTPPRFSREIAAAIAGSALTVLPDVGHGMFWETPQQFNAALLQFLAECRA